MLLDSRISPWSSVMMVVIVVLSGDQRPSTPLLNFEPIRTAFYPVCCMHPCNWLIWEIVNQIATILYMCQLNVGAWNSFHCVLLNYIMVSTQPVHSTLFLILLVYLGCVQSYHLTNWLNEWSRLTDKNLSFPSLNSWLCHWSLLLLLLSSNITDFFINLAYSTRRLNIC